MNIEFNIPKLLWLDDVRDPFAQDWTDRFSPLSKPYIVCWVKSYDEFVSWINENGLPSAICFDHDLADEHYAPQEHWDDKYQDWANSQNFKEKTGHECAKWLVEYCMDNDIELPLWSIQSDNTPGKANINGLLISYLKHCENERRK